LKIIFVTNRGKEGKSSYRQNKIRKKRGKRKKTYPTGKKDAGRESGEGGRKMIGKKEVCECKRQGGKGGGVTGTGKRKGGMNIERKRVGGGGN